MNRVKLARNIACLAIILFLVWIMAIGLPANLLHGIGPLTSVKITLTNSNGPALGKMYELSDPKDIAELDNALRNHWDPIGGNLSLLKFTLEVRDTNGINRQFSFNKTSFSRYGNTPDVLKHIISNAEVNSFENWDPAETTESNHENN